ncbi:MAG: hypothetical protein HZB65_01865 [Candidatus Aenigmarchaeota archaeon]|nr:hypothetical protein [Candidatus Aenigmarchaeota archaeon]
MTENNELSEKQRHLVQEMERIKNHYKEEREKSPRIEISVFGENGKFLDKWMSTDVKLDGSQLKRFHELFVEFVGRCREEFGG